MTRRKRDLAQTLREVIAEPTEGDYTETLDPWNDKTLTLADTEGLVAVLAEQTDVKPLVEERHGKTLLDSLALLFQNDSSDDASRLLRDRGIPELARLFDAAMELPDCPAHPMAIICKMLALYAYAPGLDRVARAVRRYPDEYLWQVVFGLYEDERHPHGPDFVNRLHDPLPDQFAGILLLDLANGLSRQERLEKHPYDTPEGHRRLEAWLADSNPDHFNYAHSAAATLPFINASTRNALAALAMDHPNANVQIEAAWASAYRGGTAGLKFLARMCEDVRYSCTARQYLEELDKADHIPAKALEPDFDAMAQMCRWLAHPSEFGEPPTEIELYDTRELHWPPTDDFRRLWLFKYTYAGRNEDGSDDVGLGMVGSITFALFGETTADMSPEDAYGVHCCWELEVNEDPRAPKERSAKAGRKLLKI